MNHKLWENIILEESTELSLSELRILNKKLNCLLQKKTELKQMKKSKPKNKPIEPYTDEEEKPEDE